MAYRKILALQIFDGYQFYSNRVLILTNTGAVADLIAKEEAGDDVETVEGILCPGFVNAHCHTELSHMQNAIPQHTGMVPFLTTVMFNRQANEATKQQAIQQGIEKMQQQGIVAVGDICNTADSIAAKKAFPAMRFHHFIETSGFTPAGAGSRFAASAEVYQEFIQSFPNRQVSITPHAPYSVSANLFELIANQLPGIVAIHNQESEAEDDFIRNKQGPMLELYKAIGANIDFFAAQNRSSLQYYTPLLPQQAQWLLVHNCHTKQEDIDTVFQQKKAAEILWCLCPNANLYIGNPLPDIDLFIKNQLQLCVGTDSLASNTGLSILAELQTIQQHFTNISLQNLLQWATLNGAKALKLDDTLGSFEKGKTPGVVLLENIENGSLKKAQVKKIV